MRAHRLLVAAIVCGLAVQAVSGDAADVLGTKPGHVFFGPSAVPNDQAILTRIWARR